VSRSKTEYLCFNGTEQDSIELGIHMIQQRNVSKHLGSKLWADGESTFEVQRRIQENDGILCDIKAPLKVKGKIINTYPAMIYAAETVATYKKAGKQV